MAKTQEELKVEEQKILDQLIRDMDTELLKLNQKMSYESLQARKAMEKCLPDVYGDLISAETNKADADNVINNLSRGRDELYERRLIVDITDEDKLIPEEKEIKVGLHTYTRLDKVFIMSWKMPICRPFTIDSSLVDYDGIVEDKNGTKYNTHYHLKLKRQVEIFFDQVKKVTHYYPELDEEMEKVIADEFLQELLKRRSESEFQNIVFSIQKHQGEIIQAPFQKNLIVQGCAGSGKSMIMLHRLPVLMYDNPNTLNQANLYIITPSTAYMQQVESMRVDLEIEKLKMGTLEQYYDQVIKKYGRETKAYGTINPSLQLSQEMEQYVYSEGCTKDICAGIKTRIDREKIDCSDGCVTLNMQIEGYGKQIKTKSEEVRYEILGIQKLINENNQIIRKYFLEIRNLVAQLEDLVGFLESRKIVIMRALDRRISEERNRIVNAQDNLSQINREAHEIMYQNRINTIKAAENKIKKYEGTKQLIDLNEDYFEFLKKEAERIQRITQAFAYSKIDIEKVALKSKYDMIERKSFLCDNCDSIQKEMEQLDDPYWEYAVGWAPIVRKVVEASEELRQDTAKYLTYDYLLTLEETNRSLQELDEAIVNSTYAELMTNIMQPLGWESEQNGNMIALKCSPYLYLRVLYAYYGAPQGAKESLITIDEAQNLAPEELRLIQEVNSNRVILNLYGDVKQHVESEKGIDEWTEIEKIAHFQNFNMKENYRNARQITEYCNRRFHLNMRAINLDGRGVHEITTQEKLKQTLATVLQNTPNQGLSCILVKNAEEADTVLEMFPELRSKVHNITRDWLEIQINKWNLMTAEQVKGLEFGTVFALSGRMSMNEKYIAYTRALDELYVFDLELTLINPARLNSETEYLKTKEKSESKNTREKSDRKKRDKGEKTKTQMSNQEIGLKEFLEKSGLTVIDKRNKGGALWVVGSHEEIGDIIDKAVEKYEISGAYSSSKTTGHRTGWYTKAKK